MPATRKRTEFYVGLFIFTGCVLFGGLVLQFGKFRERLAGRYPLTIVFDDASGVIKGSEIRMGGARIGDVERTPELNSEVKVEVTLSIDKSIPIPEGSKFLIASATLLGDKLIIVSPPEDRTAPPIAPGSRLEGAGLTGFDAIQNNAEKVTEDVIRIIRKAEVTLDKVDVAVNGLQTASGELQQSLAKVNGSVLSQTNLDHLQGTLHSLAEVAGKWNAASDKLDPTLNDARAAIADVRASAARFDETLKSADRAFDKFGPTLDQFSNTAREFSATSREAKTTLAKINHGEGLLGALAADNEVAFDAKVFMRNLKNYGILRYRNPAPETGKKPEEKTVQPFSGNPRR